MVRLKDIAKAQQEVNDISFQFQYGTIKSYQTALSGVVTP